MSELNQACQTSDADLCKNALDHYNELADKAHSWLSSVPHAIRFYFLERPALESEVAALRAEVEIMRDNAERYEVVRRMHVEQFARIFKRNIQENIPFDDLIDVWRKESSK